MSRRAVLIRAFASCRESCTPLAAGTEVGRQPMCRHSSPLEPYRLLTRDLLYHSINAPEAGGVPTRHTSGALIDISKVRRPRFFLAVSCLGLEPRGLSAIRPLSNRNAQRSHTRKVSTQKVRGLLLRKRRRGSPRALAARSLPTAAGSSCLELG
jgi:hypothetical protein